MSNSAVDIDPNTGYFKNITAIRQREYPQLQGTTYLDHAGTTLYAQSLIDACSQDLKSNLYGNPHSGAESSQRSSKRIDETRLKLLQYFRASPDDFDIVFTANATAAIKLVAEALRDHKRGFTLLYHADCHNSVVGVRELAKTSHCIAPSQPLSGSKVKLSEEIRWHSLRQLTLRLGAPMLLAFPGQSNLTGHRLDLRMFSRVRGTRTHNSGVYTLLDAAGLVSTSHLDLSDAASAPDFTALSLYKIFGFPDLGALIVRKKSAGILLQKRYFAGGTVDVVTVDKPWYIRSGIIHEALEEGTLPFHSIIALDHAMDIHAKLYGSPSNVSRHARHVASLARTRLLALKHSNETQLCRIYGVTSEATQGPVIAFNLQDPSGQVFRTSTVEKHAIAARISLRVGGMCNPGGIAENLRLPGKIVRILHDNGVHCADDSAVPEVFTYPIGMVRVSFGAMSSVEDVHRLLEFVQKQFRDRYVKDVPTARRETVHRAELEGSVPQRGRLASWDACEKEVVSSAEPVEKKKGWRYHFSCLR